MTEKHKKPLKTLNIYVIKNNEETILWTHSKLEAIAQAIQEGHTHVLQVTYEFEGSYRHLLCDLLNKKPLSRTSHKIWVKS